MQMAVKHFTCFYSRARSEFPGWFERFWSASMFVVPKSNHLFTENVDVSCLNLLTFSLCCQQTKLILTCSPSAMSRKHLLPPKHRTRTLKAQNTFREQVNQRWEAIIDEPMSGPLRQFVQPPSGFKGGKCKPSEKCPSTITMQAVASSTATGHSLDQASDTTDDQFEPAKPNTPDVQLADFQLTTTIGRKKFLSPPPKQPKQSEKARYSINNLR